MCTAGRVGVVLVASMLVCGRAHATCTESKENARAPADPRTRLLLREADHARTWRYVWTSIGGGLTILPIAGFAVLPKSERGELLVSASASLVLTAFTWFWPLDVEDDAERAAHLEPSTDSACDAELNRLLLHSTQDEASRYAWPWHVGNFLAALVPAAIILFAFHDRPNAALAVVGGFALGEAELATQPTALMHQPASAPIASPRARTPLSLGYRATW